MKTTIYKIKNTLNGINGRIDIAEEKVSELVNIVIKTVHNETQRKKCFKK